MKPLPPCFSGNFLRQIWDEVLTEDYPPLIRDAIIERRVFAPKEMQMQFVQAAMEYPHFASAGDICFALGVNVRAANVMINVVKRHARENRK